MSSKHRGNKAGNGANVLAIGKGESLYFISPNSSLDDVGEVIAVNWDSKTASIEYGNRGDEVYNDGVVEKTASPISLKDSEGLSYEVMLFINSTSAKELRLGIRAPKRISVYRQEIVEKKMGGLDKAVGFVNQNPRGN